MGGNNGTKEREAQPAVVSGAEVRAQRLELGLKQEDLAVAAGVGIRTVRNVERGHSRPKADVIAAIVGALRKRAAEKAGPKRSA